MLQFFEGINNFKSFNLSLFLKKERSNLLCLDIGTSNIKAVEVSNKEGILKLDKYYILPLPAGSIEGHQIKDKQALTTVLSSFIADNNYQGHDTALILSGPQVVTQILNVPNEFADNQLTTHIELEADKCLPFDIEDLSMDYDVLDTGENNEGNLEVLLAAAKKDYVNEFIELIEQVQLNLRVIDVYSCVMGRLSFHVAPVQLQKDISDQVVAMIDIGHDILTLSIYKNERQVYLKEQGFGSKFLLNDIMKAKSVDYEGAQKLVLEQSDPSVLHLMNNFSQKSSMQIYHMLQFFYASAYADEINYAFLIGGITHLPDLVETVKTKINLPTAALDPFALINSKGFKTDERFSALSSCLAPVCGLALRSYVE